MVKDLLCSNIFINTYGNYNYIDIHPAVERGALSGSVYNATNNPGNRDVMVNA